MTLMHAAQGLCFTCALLRKVGDKIGAAAACTAINSLTTFPFPTTKLQISMSAIHYILMIFQALNCFRTLYYPGCNSAAQVDGAFT